MWVDRPGRAASDESWSDAAVRTSSIEKSVSIRARSIAVRASQAALMQAVSAGSVLLADSISLE